VIALRFARFLQCDAECCIVLHCVAAVCLAVYVAVCVAVRVSASNKYTKMVEVRLVPWE